MSLTFKQHQLSNGLDVVAEINGDAHSIALGFFVKTGSRDEPAQINGVSHFLEHMMFKGSSKYTCHDVNRIFDELGARYNAFTSQEMTAYYANVLPEFTERAMEHLSHLMRPAIRIEDFTTEKEVVLEEIAMCQDEPGHRLYEKLMKTYFSSHPLAMPVLGSADSIRRLGQQEMSDYFMQRYGPGSFVLVATGRLDFDEIVRLAEKYCGSWKKVDAPRQQPAVPVEARREGMVDPKLNRQYTMCMTPGPAADDNRRFAARVLSDVLGDAEGSRLYWALVDNAIAEEADLGFSPHDGCGTYYLSLTTEPDRAAQALEIAMKEIERVKQDLNEDEVARARNKIATNIILQGEVPLGRLSAIGSQWIYNHEYRSLELDMQTLMSVNIDSLRALLKDFPFDPMTVVSLGPAKI